MYTATVTETRRYMYMQEASQSNRLICQLNYEVMFWFSSSQDKTSQTAQQKLSEASSVHSQPSPHSGVGYTFSNRALPVAFPSYPNPRLFSPRPNLSCPKLTKLALFTRVLSLPTRLLLTFTFALRLAAICSAPKPF